MWNAKAMDCMTLAIGACRCARAACRGADLSVAERHRHRRLPGRRARRHHRRGWSRPSSKRGSSKASWWRTAAAPAATSPPRRSGAAPDGYTLLATTSGLAANITASKNRGFEQSDLRPVAFVAISPDVIAVHPSNPAKDLKEFIANAKTKSFTYGSAGVGTGPQIGAEYFFQEVAKVKYVHVPFQGGAPAITAALGNHVDALVLTLPPTVPQIRQRRVARPRRRERQAQFGDPGRADLRRDGLSQRVLAVPGSASSRRPRRPTPWCSSSTPRSTR